MLLFAVERRHLVGSATVDDTALGKVANGLLAVLGILFVPAGVGVIQDLALLREYGAALAAALVVSTLLTLSVTVWVFVGVSRLMEAKASAWATPFSLWVYLATTPLLWLTLTVVIWVLADWLAQLSGHNPLVNPVMIAIAAISAILPATGTPTAPTSTARSSSISCSGPPPWPSPFPCTRTGRSCGARCCRCWRP